MNKILTCILLLSCAFAYADSCDDEKAKAQSDYEKALSELKAEKYVTKNGTETNAETMAREFYADLKYFEGDIKQSLSEVEKKRFDKNPLAMIKDKKIAEKFKHVAEIHDMEYSIDDGQLFVCSKSYDNKALKMAFCDFLNLPDLAPYAREWGADDYIRQVFFINGSTYPSTHGKTYKGIELKTSVKRYVEKRSKTACENRVQDTPRDPKATTEKVLGTKKSPETDQVKNK